MAEFYTRHPGVSQQICALTFGTILFRLLSILSALSQCFSKGGVIVRRNPSWSHWRVFEAFEPLSSRHFICLMTSCDVIWCHVMFKVFEPSDPQTQSLRTLRPRDIPRPFLLFSLIPFISLVISFVFDICLTYIDIQLTFDSTLYVGLYIRLCQQDDPHSFLFWIPC